jgi:hypothetical protein
MVSQLKVSRVLTLRRRSAFPVEVPLWILFEADAQSHLTASGEGAVFVSHTATSVEVALRSPKDGIVDVWETRPTISERSIRLGRLAPSDGEAYRTFIAAAERVGQVVTVAAMRMPGTDDRWRLWIRVPPSSDDR